MFVLLLFVLPILLPVVATLTDDPAPGVLRTKEEARNLDCERMSESGARQLHPGMVAEPAPRGDYIETGAVLCRERMMAQGERPARDEAILSELDGTAAALTAMAGAVAPELDGKTWLVEAYYPDLAVAAKIAFATKVALVGRGRRVSDRVPVLASGDILVLGRMDPAEAYPLACRRYHDEGALTDDDVLLAAVLRDRRETVLHAGICSAGQWRWLQ